MKRLGVLFLCALGAIGCDSNSSTCPASDCGGTCADTSADPLNCGACGHACSAGESCSNGVCGREASNTSTGTGSSGVTGSTATAAGSTTSGSSSNAGSTSSGSSGSGASSTSSGTGGASSGTGGASSGTGAGAASSSSTSTGSGGASSGTGGGGTGGTATCSAAPVSAKAASLVASQYQSWKTAHVKDCAANASAIVSNGGGVVSEGIGYGMLLAANNDDRALFDKLWKFYGDHLDPNGLMNWSMPECDPPGNNNANSATDGDLDTAMALAQADARWGGYTTQALGLIGKIKAHETDSCLGLNVLRPGDMFGGCSDPNNMGRVNPSYFAPGYYRVFAKLDTTNAAFWSKLADDSYTLLAMYQSQMNGLAPNWANVNGALLDGTYGYDACRTPWRVAVDYLWFCTPAAKTFLTGVSGYVDGKGGIGSVPFDKNSAFLGALALSGVASGQAKLDGYVDGWLAATVDDTPYYQGTLKVLYLQAAAGQFSSSVAP